MQPGTVLAASVFLIGVSLSQPTICAEKPLSPTAATATTTTAKALSKNAAPMVKASPTPAMKDTVLYTAKAGSHLALVRMDVMGGCKYFLSQSTHRGWVRGLPAEDRKSTRLNSSHIQKSRMPSSA